jgi:hypothetical protein
MFSWGSTFGSFALVLIYLLLAVGACARAPASF